MEKIRITFTNNQTIRNHKDCIILEESQIKNGEHLNIIYELYGFSEITNPIEGTCFLEIKKDNNLKYCIVNDNFNGNLPIDLAKEFYNTFNQK